MNEKFWEKLLKECEILFDREMLENKSLYFDTIEEELVIKAKSGDNMSTNKLITRYEPLCKKISRLIINKFPNIPIEREDLINELRVEVFRLTQKFDEERGVSFGSYLYGFLYKRAINYCRYFTTLNHQVINYSSCIEDENEFRATSSDNNSLSEVIKKEILELDVLTVTERMILQEYLSEKTMEETIVKLNISKSSYYRHFNLGKEKIKRIYTLIDI